ncbi:hypothetical protein R3P38DRAFT_2414657, partial [Favolaschia claudopus]
LSSELPVSIAARRAEGTKQMAGKWKEEWQQSPRAIKLSRLDRTPPSKRVLKLYKDRTRAEASVVTQLRTGHIGLNALLYRIKAVNSPLCAKC